VELSKKEIVSVAIETIVKVVILALVLYWAFLILKPFMMLVIWAVIIAVTLSPIVRKLESILKIKRSLVVYLMTFVMVMALVVPSYMLSDSIIATSQNLAHKIKEGSVQIPPPNENVASWPLVGEKLYTLWDGAVNNLEKTLQQFRPQIKEYGTKVASAASGVILTVLQFVASLIIAAIFLSKEEGSVKVYHAISHRLMGQKGVEWAQLSALTIRSVVQGVIGIALIQSTLSLIGMMIMDVPLAPLLALLFLFLAIIQLPLLILAAPIIAYVFSVADTTAATIFAVYMVIVSASDGFLKPLLLGRGVDIPMLVILLGAIGGMILSGIIGLFVGAVILALAYKLFTTWLESEVKDELAKETLT